MSPIIEPESRLVYATDPREMPPRPPTHFTVRSPSTAAYLAISGAEVITFVTDNGAVFWRAPIATRVAAKRFEATMSAIIRGRDRARRAAQEKTVA